MGGLLHCVGKCARGDLRCDASLLERTPLVCGATQDEAHFGMVGVVILRNISIAYSHPRARGIYTKQSLFWDEWHHSLFVHLLLYRSSFLLTHSFKKTITRVATLDVMGYTFAQIKTIPFLVLAFAAAHAHESQFRYQKKNMLIMIWKRHGRVWLFIYVYIRTCAFVRVDLSVRVRLFVDLFMCLYVHWLMLIFVPTDGSSLSWLRTRVCKSIATHRAQTSIPPSESSAPRLRKHGISKFSH